MKNIIITLFIILFSAGSFAQQAPGYIDSLENKLIVIRNTNPDKDGEVLVLLKICYSTLNDPIKSSNYGKQALELARTIGNKKAEAIALAYLGESEKRLGNTLNAIDHLTQAANINHELKDYHGESNNLSSLAKLFANIGDMANASHYYTQAIELLTSYHDTLFAATLKLNMGEFYRKYGQPDSALFYFTSALDNFNSIKNKTYPELLEDNRITTIGNLGMVHFARGDIDKAKPFLEQAIQFFTENFDPYRKSVYQCELGKIYVLEDNNEKGLELITESLQMAKGAQLKEQIRDFSLVLSQQYEQQSSTTKALVFYKQYKAYDDSLKDVENVRKLEQQQSQFQLSRKDEEIAVLNKINRLQRLLGLGLFAGILGVIVFIFVLISTNRKIKTINKEIIRQKQLVEEREKEKGLLLRELNHRVKNNLQMVASLLNLHSRQLKGHPAADALMAGKYRVEALTLIHQKLYRDDVDTKIDLKDYIEELAQNLVMNFSQDFKLELFLVPFIMKIDKAIPLGLILNELLTNSLKYGKIEGQQPVLRIAIQKLSENVVLKIEDNGKGLPADFDFRHAESFGLKLVHSLINQLGGKIEWNSENGTRWTITLNTLKIS